MNTNVKNETCPPSETVPVAVPAPARAECPVPPVNIIETAEGYRLEAEMPGVNKDGLEVSLEGSDPTLAGRRSPADGRMRRLYRESSDRDFRRVFVLDPTVDTASLGAHLENGVLTLLLPRAAQAQPRRIAISG